MTYNDHLCRDIINVIVNESRCSEFRWSLRRLLEMLAPAPGDGSLFARRKAARGGHHGLRQLRLRGGPPSPRGLRRGPRAAAQLRGGRGLHEYEGPPQLARPRPDLER